MYLPFLRIQHPYTIGTARAPHQIERRQLGYAPDTNAILWSSLQPKAPCRDRPTTRKPGWRAPKGRRPNSCLRKAGGRTPAFCSRELPCERIVLAAGAQTTTEQSEEWFATKTCPRYHLKAKGRQFYVAQRPGYLHSSRCALYVNNIIERKRYSVSHQLMPV